MENCSLIKSTFLINPKLSKFQFGGLQLTFEGVKTHHEILIFEFFFLKTRQRNQNYFDLDVPNKQEELAWIDQL